MRLRDFEEISLVSTCWFNTTWYLKRQLQNSHLSLLLRSLLSTLMSTDYGGFSNKFCSPIGYQEIDNPPWCNHLAAFRFHSNTSTKYGWNDIFDFVKISVLFYQKIGQSEALWVEYGTVRSFIRRFTYIKEYQSELILQ